MKLIIYLVCPCHTLEYLSNHEFVSLLTTNSLPTLVIYNINSIPHNLDNFIVTSGFSIMQETIQFMLFCETKLSIDIVIIPS